MLKIPAALHAILLCSGLVLQTGPALADEAKTYEPIAQKTLLNYLAGKEKFTLIDARSPAEYDAGHIWGATNVPANTDLDTADLPEALDSPLVVYCKSGVRAETLQTNLLAKGYTNVRVLGPAQMLWADDLPVFNCGASAPGATELITVDSQNAIQGDIR